MGDHFVGGPGHDDYFVDDPEDTITELPNQGTDSVTTALLTYTLPDNVEWLFHTGTAGSTLLSGTTGDNRFFTGNGSDFIDASQGGHDWVNAAGGDDTLYFGAEFVSDFIDGGLGLDTLILEGEYTGTRRIVFGVNQTSPSIEVIEVKAGFDYEIATNSSSDAVPVFNLLIDGQDLGAADVLSFDARYANAAAYLVYGGLGDDHIHGADGNDQLHGGGGTDRLYGGEGSDLLDGGSGLDYFSGGLGDDVFLLDHVDERAYDLSGEGIDEVRTTLASYVLSDSDAEAIENLTGLLASGHTLTGNRLDNTLVGGEGADTLEGGDGSDILRGGAGDDILRGGAGIDTADYSSAGNGVTMTLASGATGEGNDVLTGIENVVGSGFADAITGSYLANRIEAGAGDDEVRGVGGADFLDGGAGSDRLYGGGGADDLHGGAADDTLYGDEDDDVIHGDLGDDRLSGGGGNDTLFGDDGNDVLLGNTGADAMHGGAGNDIYHIDAAGDTVTEAVDDGIDEVRATGINFVLPDSVENLRILSGTFDGTGNTLANTILGSDSANVISGLSGNDDLRGLGGSDTIDGGDGTDLITGGAGRDSMTGGLGADQFLFTDVGASTPGALNADTLLDFSHAQGDRIRLNAIDAVPGGADNPFAFIGRAAFSHTAGELRYRFEASTGDTIVEMDVNGDGLRDMSIRLTGHHELVAGDFLL